MPTPTLAPGDAEQLLSERPGIWSPGTTLGVPRPPASWGVSSGIAETQATDSEEENTEDNEAQQRKEVQQTQDEEEEDDEEEDGADEGLMPTDAEVGSTACNAPFAEAAAVEQYQTAGCTATAMSLASAQQMQEGEGKQEEEAGEEEEDEEDEDEEQEEDKASTKDEVLISGNIDSRSMADVHNPGPAQPTSRTAADLSTANVEQTQEEGGKAEEEEDVEDDEVVTPANIEARCTTCNSACTKSPSVQHDSATGSTAAAMSLAEVLIAAAQEEVEQKSSLGSEANDRVQPSAETLTGNQLESTLSRVPSSACLADGQRVDFGGSAEDQTADSLRENMIAAALSRDGVPVLPRRIRLSTKSPATLFRPIATPIRQERNRKLTEAATSSGAVRSAASAGSHTSYRSSPCSITSAASASKREKDCKPSSQTAAAASVIDTQLSKLGHTLQPAQQGQRVQVHGDGWGGSGPGFDAIVTEADNSTFTVIVLSGADAWKETHVLQEHCHPVVDDDSSPVAGRVVKKRRVSAGKA
eukprot:TRINITY_DN21361_c0_g1_i1.p1 TRINITY_DN21361_c0_g1~~TRINITY_DN21361_c0_g1_i1.p1  ORF type:complete len:541 (-),score=133.82 TRINITY_DN21361_c0_g1_i1:406-1989(-)